jgi:hypothetical protein
VKVRAKGVFTDYMASFQTRNNTAVTLVLAYGKDFESATKVTLGAIGGYTSMVTTTTRNYDIDYSGIVYLNLGDKVWLTWFVSEMTTTGGTYNDIQFSWNYELLDFKIEIDSQVAATEVKTVMIHEAFNQVADSIADSDGNFKSELYGRPDSDKIAYPAFGKQSKLALSDGLNLRLFPDKDISISLDKLFRAANALHNIGLAIYQDKIRVEPLEWFYKNKRLGILKNVPSFTASVDPTRYYNQIFAGCERWETEFQGGLNEPNTKHEYTTRVKSIKNVLNILSPIIASSFALELTRRKNINRLPSTDWKYDNEHFWLALWQSDLAAYPMDTYSFMFSPYSGGVNVKSEYNIRLSPARMLLAHFNRIAACLQTIEGKIDFVKGEGNTTMSVTKNSVGNRQEDYNFQPLAENQSFDFDDANVKNVRPLWVPEIYQFEYPLTDEEYEMIQADPYGFLDFYSDPMDIRSGFILEMDYSLKDSKAQFKLLKRYRTNGR